MRLIKKRQKAVVWKYIIVLHQRTCLLKKEKMAVLKSNFLEISSNFGQLWKNSATTF